MKKFIAVKLGLLGAFVVCLYFIQLTPAMAFQFQDVANKAKKLARTSFKQPEGNLPDFLKNITYDQYRDIRFKNTQTLWGHERVPFKIRFFHLGFLYKWPVKINYVDHQGTHPVDFSPDLFDYGKNNFSQPVPAHLGFAGFRVHFPINKPSYDDEVAVFLGATYFRAVAQNQGYGLSARGLAINTASAGGEEFPFFKEFWIIKPSSNAKYIKIYALMDSPSASGAYQFIVIPGKTTVMKVTCILYTRTKIDKLGLAPMTSMFFYGENSANRPNDYRPQVHDSDGLMIWTKWGEWIWRPLLNPKSLQINTFEVATPKGFGLFQRDRNFDHYQDLESRFDLRPSLWAMPQKDWGKGHIELVEIPSDGEHNDNINAYWVPAQSPEAHQTLKFSYTLEWGFGESIGSPLSRVTDTRVVSDGDHQGAKFLLDFQGKAIDSIIDDKKLDAEIHLSKGFKIVQQQLYKNVVTHGWRLVFQIQLDQEGPLKNIISGQKPAADLQVYLKEGSRVLSETWTYTYFF